MRSGWILGVVLVSVACAPLNPGNDDAGTGGTDATTGGTDGGGGTSETLSVSDAIAREADFRNVVVKVTGVVTALRSFTATNGGIGGSVYIMDETGGTRGIQVFKGSSDPQALPAIGDKVEVSGRLSRFSGVLQVAASSARQIVLTITKVGTGTVSGGAYPPAGEILEKTIAELQATGSDAFFGNAVHIPGPLEVTNPTGLRSTFEDGGSNPAGFEVTGGFMVNNGYVYQSCIRSLDGGNAALDLSTGITGVFDVYQDFYAGTAQDPAPQQRVLYPHGCGDVNVVVP